MTFDRREFIGAAGSLAAAASLPAATFANAVPVEPDAAEREWLTDWTIDDVCGVYTRYADPVGYGHANDPLDLAPDPLEALLSA